MRMNRFAPSQGVWDIGSLHPGPQGVVALLRMLAFMLLGNALSTTGRGNLC